MDLSTFVATFKEFGIAGLAIGAILFLSLKLVKVLDKNQELLQKNQDDYRNYVATNNHTTTDLVKEATATMVEVKFSIQNHNLVLREFLDRLPKNK